MQLTRGQRTFAGCPPSGNNRKQMKFLSLLLLSFALPAFGQDAELYRLAFTNRAHFAFLKNFGHRVPATFLIRDTAEGSGPLAFWIEGLDTASAATINAMAGDEHHPYNSTYLFRDSSLDRLFSTDEKKALARTASSLHPQRLNLKGPGYRSIHIPPWQHRDHVRLQAPVYSPGRRYAFVSMYIVFNRREDAEWWEQWAVLTILYHKEGTKWKEVNASGHFIL
jgi:hypothetical protein